MEKLKVKEILDNIETIFPDAHCELNYNNIFELIIAVSLSAQTTDARVNVITKELFLKYPDPISLANADIVEVERIIRPVGLSKNKSKNIINLSKKLVSDYGSNVPNTIEELITLSGVGRKTANVIMSEGFGIPAIAVDTHVSRVANRLGLSNSSDVVKIEQDLMESIERERWHKAHHLLLFFGRYLCKAKNPNCENCPFRKDICTITDIGNN